MVFRTCIFSSFKDFNLTYNGEDYLYVLSTKEVCNTSYLLAIKKSLAYSCENEKVTVFLYIYNKSWKRSSRVYIIKNGLIRYTAFSVEEGAASRVVYHGIGLSVGNDYKSLLNYNLMLGGAKLILSMCGENLSKESSKILFGYKNISSIPVLFGFSDGFYMVHNTIKPIENKKNYQIDLLPYTIRNGYGIIRSVN